MTGPRPLRTVQAAVGLLECFDADHTEWTLSDLARHLNQPVSSVHEHLTTLASTGLLTRLGRGRYALGWRLLKLSSALYSSLPWYGHAHAAMERVARGTHLLAFLCVLDGPPQRERLLCVARSVQGRDGPPVAGELDFELPVHATASGQLLLALARRQLPPDPARFTPLTLWTPDAWTERSDQIRRDGHAITCDEWANGTSGMAVPILTAGGVQLAALGVSLPSHRLRESETLLRTLLEAAGDVNWTLGHRQG